MYAYIYCNYQHSDIPFPEHFSAACWAFNFFPLLLLLGSVFQVCSGLICRLSAGNAFPGLCSVQQPAWWKVLGLLTSHKSFWQGLCFEGKCERAREMEMPLFSVEIQSEWIINKLIWYWTRAIIWVVNQKKMDEAWGCLCFLVVERSSGICVSSINGFINCLTRAEIFPGWMSCFSEMTHLKSVGRCVNHVVLGRLLSNFNQKF